MSRHLHLLDKTNQNSLPSGEAYKLFARCFVDWLANILSNLAGWSFTIGCNAIPPSILASYVWIPAKKWVCTSFLLSCETLNSL